MALHHLAGLTQDAIWAWTDGSADGGVLRGGAGALIIGADDDRAELRRPAGTLCSSFRAEMVALQMTLDHILDQHRDTAEPVIICTDSMSAVAALREGPSAQRTARGAAVWRQLTELTTEGRHTTLQSARNCQTLDRTGPAAVPVRYRPGYSQQRARSELDQDPIRARSGHG